MIDPNDLLNISFEKKMGGYKSADVDSFMVEAASLFSQQKREIAELKRRIEADQVKLSEYDKDRDNLRDALLNAQRLSESIVREAREKAEKIEQEAAGKANSLIGEMRGEIIAEQEKLLQIKREVSAFRSKLMNIYRAHIVLINDIPALHEEGPQTAPPDQPDTQADEHAAAAEKPEEKVLKETMAQTAVALADESASETEAPETPEETADDVSEETARRSLDVKLNVRFDEESGEYIPFPDKKNNTNKRK